MKRIALPALALGLLCGPAWAGEETVQYRSGDETVAGLLVKPEGRGPFPAVVVIHEWWGLNDWVKARARALAKEGYAALAVDLYRGKATADRDEAHQLAMGAPEDRAVRDLRAAVAYLHGRPDVVAARIGSIGWCMGGKYSLRLAVEQPNLAATVVYYGAPPTDPSAIDRLETPLLGNFGANDKGPSPDQVKAFEAALRKRGRRPDFKIYEGAGHAFANENNPFGGYRADAAQDAWTRTLAFFAAHLKK